MIPRRRATPPPSPEVGLIATPPEPAPVAMTPTPSPAPIAAPIAAPVAVTPPPPKVVAAPPPSAPIEEGRVRALRGKIPHRKIGVRLDRERYQRLKRHAVDHGLSVEEIAIAALDRYLADRRSS
jgi:hypothetical protein